MHENDTESHMSNACTEHADDNAHLSHTVNTPVFPDGERIDSDTEITVSDIFEHGDKVGEERTDGEAARGNSALNMEGILSTAQMFHSTCTFQNICAYIKGTGPG